MSFLVHHAINIDDAMPNCMATRLCSLLNHDHIDSALTDMLANGIIIPSINDWVLEPHLVKKDDNTFHFYIDLRPLNTKYQSMASIPSLAWNTSWIR